MTDTPREFAGDVRKYAAEQRANSTSKCNTSQASWGRAFPIRCKTQAIVIKGFASNRKCPSLWNPLVVNSCSCCTSKLNSRSIAEEAALAKGMEKKSKEFVEKGAEVYTIA